MVMEISQHEEHINGVLSLITDGEQRATALEHLEALRSDYGQTVQEYNDLTVEGAKLKNEKEALLISNSQYFRNQSTIPPEQPEDLTASENVTLESLGM